MHNDEECPYREDAKKWEKLNSAFRDKIDWSNIEYFALKEANGTPHVARLFDEDKDILYPDLLKIEKDRQIVKRLEERIKNEIDDVGSPIGVIVKEELQKILEGKK